MKKLADLCCKAGGAGMGYHRAGFKVIGFDVEPQPNYPFEFVQADALEVDLSEFDVIHASPPCQKYSWGARRWKNIERLDLVEPVRKKVKESGKPYIIENVVGAPLIDPIMLCGRMFGLGVIRHRLFESNLRLTSPKHHLHKWSVKSGKYCTVAGHGGDGKASFSAWKEAMGIDWMTKQELTQAIPPAYTQLIGEQIYYNLSQCHAADTTKTSRNRHGNIPVDAGTIGVRTKGRDVCLFHPATPDYLFHGHGSPELYDGSLTNVGEFTQSEQGEYNKRR